MGKDYIRISEAARILGVHGNTIRGWIEKGYVRVMRLPSGERRVSSEDVQKLKGP